MLIEAADSGWPAPPRTHLHPDGTPSRTWWVRWVRRVLLGTGVARHGPALLPPTDVLRMAASSWCLERFGARGELWIERLEDLRDQLGHPGTLDLLSRSGSRRRAAGHLRRGAGRLRQDLSHLRHDIGLLRRDIGHLRRNRSLRRRNRGLRRRRPLAGLVAPHLSRILTILELLTLSALAGLAFVGGWNAFRFDPDHRRGPEPEWATVVGGGTAPGQGLGPAGWAPLGTPPPATPPVPGPVASTDAPQDGTGEGPAPADSATGGGHPDPTAAPAPTGPAPQPRPRPPAPTPTPTPRPPTPAPVPQPSTPSPPAPSTTTPPPPSSTFCAATVNFRAVWPGGFTVDVVLTNTSPVTWNGWTSRFSVTPAAGVTGSWGATISTSGTAFTAVPLDWDTVVQPGQSVTLGFNGSTSAGSTRLTGVTVQGRSCTTG